MHSAQRQKKSPKNRAAGAVSSVCLDPLESRRLFSHVVFTVDPSQSSLALSGNVNGTAITAQIAGGLSDSFGGSIDAKIIAGHTIQFISSNIAAEADLAGATPTSKAEANYAFDTILDSSPAQLAIRGLVLDLSSGQISIDSETESFISTPETFDQVTGNLKYASEGENGGSNDVFSSSASNTSASESTFGFANGALTLTIPVDVTLTSLLPTGAPALTLSGQIVAAAPVATGSINGSGELIIQGTPGNDSIAVDTPPIDDIAGNQFMVEISNFGILTQSFPLSSITGGILIGGGAGDDQIDSETAATATISGGAGNDTITNGGIASSGGKNVILPGGSNDLLVGGLGNDSILCTSDSSTLQGGQGNDTLSMVGKHNLLLGGAGDDELIAPTGNGNPDTINGGAGNDTAYTSTTLDTVLNVEVIPAN